MTTSSGAWVAAEKVLTEDTVRPGLIGLVFFVALFVAVYFLWRSMNTQLRKVDENFPGGGNGGRGSRRPVIPIVDAVPPAPATDVVAPADEGTAHEGTSDDDTDDERTGEADRPAPE